MLDMTQRTASDRHALDAGYTAEVTDGPSSVHVLEDVVVEFSTSVHRVDYGPQMFRIEVSADALHADGSDFGAVGRLVAYRMYDAEVHEALQGLWFDDYLPFFDAISGDAYAAMADLVDVQKRLRTKLLAKPALCFPQNLVYVGEVYVHPAFRGHGIAKSLMAELNDFLAGTPSLVFLQALPFLSEVKAPEEDEEAWEAAHRAAVGALTEYWLEAKDLGFCQPGPRSHPQLLAASWSGKMLETFEARCQFLPRVELQAEQGEGEMKEVGDCSHEEIETLRTCGYQALNDLDRLEIALADLKADLVNDKPDILMFAGNNDIIYMAVREKDVCCGIVLVPSEPDGRLRYQVIHEDLGPFAYTAPPELIALLSPTQSQNANEWRHNCLTYAARFLERD